MDKTSKTKTEAAPVKPKKVPKRSSKASAPKTKAPPIPAPVPKRASNLDTQLSDLTRRFEETESKLRALIDILHNDLQRGQREGPEGLASKLRKAGLLS